MQKKTLGTIGLILLFGFLLRIPYFLHTMQDIDEGCYAGIAAILMDGGLPYRDAVENKPPGIFYIYLLTFLLFGKYNMQAVHMVTFAWTLCTAVVLSILAHKMGGRRSALYALFFYLTFTAALYPKMIAANSEIFMALPYSLAVLLLWHAFIGKKRCLYFIAGFISGISPFIKQVGGIEIGIVFVWLLIAVPLFHGKTKLWPSAVSCIYFGCGFILPIGAVAFHFHNLGILPDWIFWNIDYPTRYIRSGSASLNFLNQIIVEFLPFVLSTLILWVLASLWMKHILAGFRTRAESPESQFSFFILLWFAGSLCATVIGSRMFGHYFIQLLPPLSLIAAVSAGRCSEIKSEKRRRIWSYAIFVLTLLPGIIFTAMALSFEAATDTWGEIKPDFRPAAAYIKAHTGPEDRIFVWGWFTPVYVYSERTPATRFVNTHMHTGYKKGKDPNEKDRADITWYAIPEVWPMLRRDLQSHPPELIVDTSPGNYHDFGRYPIKDYAVLRTFIHNCCRLETSIAGMDIYRCR
jgi:4-amino-4-deoxy-L-arabinose transferase-like glycosyltransferase